MDLTINKPQFAYCGAFVWITEEKIGFDLDAMLAWFGDEVTVWRWLGFVANANYEGPRRGEVPGTLRQISKYMQARQTTATELLARWKKDGLIRIRRRGRGRVIRIEACQFEYKWD